MFQEITYYLIFGIPFIVHLGVVVFLLFFATMLFAFLKRKKKISYPIVWHYRLAYLSIALGFIHLILGLLAYV